MEKKVRGRPVGIPSERKGITLDKFFGIDKSKQIKAKIGNSVKNNPNVKRTWFTKGHPLLHSRKGECHSKEAKEKLSQANKGQIPWNKGLTKKEDKSLQVLAEKSSKSMLALYEAQPELRYTRTQAAHRRMRELGQEGSHPFQLMNRSNSITKPTKPQIELFNIIKQSFPDAVLECPIPQIERKADIAIPSLKLDIEYDEPYWHNAEEDKQRDKDFCSIGWYTIRIKPSDLQALKTRVSEGLEA